MEKQSGAFSYPDIQWWWGVVENRLDPKKLGRVQVRIYGYHTGDVGKMPTESLPWAIVIQSITSAANSGVGFSPTGILEGTTVWGIFLDGSSAQTPMVMGTLAGMNTGEGFEGGYKDPSGRYPKESGENDVNRLARAERVNETIVGKKRASIDTASIAFGGSWTEKTTAYDAKYPFNHVYESESGHVKEFDDTPGKERTGEWHKTGTFYEVHPDGTKVEKIVKDNYTLVLGNDYVKINGDVKIFVGGNASLLVAGNADVEINGNLRQHVHGNYALNVDGNFDVQVNGHHYENSNVHRKAIAPRIDLNP